MALNRYNIGAFDVAAAAIRKLPVRPKTTTSSHSGVVPPIPTLRRASWASTMTRASVTRLASSVLSLSGSALSWWASASVSRARQYLSEDGDPCTVARRFESHPGTLLTNQTMKPSSTTANVAAHSPRAGDRSSLKSSMSETVAGTNASRRRSTHFGSFAAGPTLTRRRRRAESAHAPSGTAAPARVRAQLRRMRVSRSSG